MSYYGHTFNTNPSCNPGKAAVSCCESKSDVATNNWPSFECKLRSGVPRRSFLQTQVSTKEIFPIFSSIFSATDQRVLMSPIGFPPKFRVSAHFLVCWIFLSCFPGKSLRNKRFVYLSSAVAYIRPKFRFNFQLAVHKYNYGFFF